MSVAPSEFRVALCGGGIAGLASALALAKHGIPSTVFERDASFDVRKQGYGLTIQQGLRAVKQLGIGPDIQRYAFSRSHFVFTSKGLPIAFWGPFMRPNTMFAPPSTKSLNSMLVDNDAFFVHLPRQELRRALLEGCLRERDLIRIEWGKTVSNITPETDGLRVHFASSSDSSARVSCVIGTDGVHSAVRASLPCLNVPMIVPRNTKPDRAQALQEMYERASTQTPGALRYLGMMVILGIFDSREISGEAERNWTLFQNRVFQTSDGVSRLFVMPFEQGRHMWQLTFRVEDESLAREMMASPSLLLREARTRCRGWHPPIPALLERTDEATVTGYPLHDALPFVASSQEAMLLLGDAAHPMSPLQGQGANQALLDALTLARELAALRPLQPQATPLYPRLVKTCRAIEEQIVVRNVPKVLTSRRQVDVLHHPDFLDPVFQSKRKTLTGVVDRVARMNRADITVNDVASGWLDLYAFGDVDS